MSTIVKFEHEFTDHGPKRFGYMMDTSPESKATIYFDNGVPVLALTKRCCDTLARILAQMSLGSVGPGFHVHIGEDIDCEKKEMLRIELVVPPSSSMTA